MNPRTLKGDYRCLKTSCKTSTLTIWTVNNKSQVLPHLILTTKIDRNSSAILKKIWKRESHGKLSTV
jgi:hypothetical protein